MVNSSTTDSSGSPSGDGSIIEFFKQPIGMALLGGIAIALVAGYVIL